MKWVFTIKRPDYERIPGLARLEIHTQIIQSAVALHDHCYIKPEKKYMKTIPKASK